MKFIVFFCLISGAISDQPYELCSRELFSARTLIVDSPGYDRSESFRFNAFEKCFCKAFVPSSQTVKITLEIFEISPVNLTSSPFLLFRMPKGSLKDEGRVFYRSANEGKWNVSAYTEREFEMGFDSFGQYGTARFRIHVESNTELTFACFHTNTPSFEGIEWPDGPQITGDVTERLSSQANQTSPLRKEKCATPSWILPVTLILIIFLVMIIAILIVLIIRKGRSCVIDTAIVTKEQRTHARLNDGDENAKSSPSANDNSNIYSLAREMERRASLSNERGSSPEVGGVGLDFASTGEVGKPERQNSPGSYPDVVITSSTPEYALVDKSAKKLEVPTGPRSVVQDTYSHLHLPLLTKPKDFMSGNVTGEN